MIKKIIQVCLLSSLMPVALADASATKAFCQNLATKSIEGYAQGSALLKSASDHIILQSTTAPDCIQRGSSVYCNFNGGVSVTNTQGKTAKTTSSENSLFTCGNLKNPGISLHVQAIFYSPDDVLERLDIWMDTTGHGNAVMHPPSGVGINSMYWGNGHYDFFDAANFYW